MGQDTTALFYIATLNVFKSCYLSSLHLTYKLTYRSQSCVLCCYDTQVRHPDIQKEFKSSSQRKETGPPSSEGLHQALPGRVWDRYHFEKASVSWHEIWNLVVENKPQELLEDGISAQTSATATDGWQSWSTHRLHCCSLIVPQGDYKQIVGAGINAVKQAGK